MMSGTCTKYKHPNEIWDLASCPFDQRIFSTVFSSGESHGAAIWKIPKLYGELNSPQLEKITSLDAHKSKPKWFFLSINIGLSFVLSYLNIGIIEDKKFVIGTLSADKGPQISFDLVLDKDFELSHDWKDGRIL
ncbi:hypothetical protein POM88_045589 [Heracleum sosnowskyi]|uniref:Uncharacterized protein n=1 Tax=Heracleum sosnowskyi TaxID=360622 RepID=A0AAD8H4Y6_9APIA|nr:hypothetical protein POM88_045589 [Heracleum sosnowskyi]